MGGLAGDSDGRNGSHASSGILQPELAGGKAPAGLNFSSSLGSNATAHARLVIERGRSVGKQFMLSDTESQIGRWDADGGIFPDVDLDSEDPEAKVSRRHARITRLPDGQYSVEDLGSTNGTFINRGKRLLPGNRQPLNDGDEIIVGKTFLRFHIVR
jgi:FHA domain-containing protein